MTLLSFASFSLPDNCFYNSHYNFFLAPQFCGLSIYVYIYADIAFVILGAFVLNRIRKKSINLARSLYAVCWIFCLTVIGVQTAHQAWYLNTAQRNIGGMSDDQRYSFLFEYSYEIAHAFTSRVPVGAPGLVVSDLKPDNLNVVVLPYFLFPKVDVVHHDRTPEYIIFFLKADMLAPVPGYFRPVVVDMKNPTALFKRMGHGR